MSPPVSEEQRKAAGAALAAKRGQMPVSKLQGAAKSMYDSMTIEQLKEYASKPVAKKK